MPAEFFSTNDNRLALRVYAWITGVAGIITTLWGSMGFETDLGGLPFGMSALVRVAGAAMAATGCWAAMLSQVEDPELRRKGLRWFAAGHFFVLLILHLQCIAVWPGAVTSKLEVPLSLEFFAVLLILGQGESFFRDNNGLPVIPVASVRAIDRLRTGYEQQIREAGAQEERNRLARDLHDSVKQQIFAIQTAAATAQARFEGDRPGAALALDQIRDAARDAMTEMEVMMDQLRSSSLESTGLRESLRKQCEALGHRTGARVEFTLGDLPSSELLEPGAYQAILRVAQEACANIGRHARAKNVTVALGLRGKSVELRVDDDGAGFDPSSVPRGMGIANMRARAEEFGGRFQLNARPREGTAVLFSVPCGDGLPARYRREMRGQMLLFGVAFLAVFLYLDAQFRLFGFLAWGFAGAYRILLYKRTVDRMRRHGAPVAP